MIDLTPLEVRKKKGDFKKTMRGYEPALVDDFLDVVADRLDQLVRENMAMTERLTRLEHQVTENRERERALTDALVTAQEMREEMRVQTTREAELVRRTAEQEVAQLRRTTEQETTQLRRTTEAETAQLRRKAEMEAAQIRSDAMAAREREEEVLRRLRARQQQLLQSYRTFLARELAELQVIGETLEIESMSGSRTEDAPPTPPAPRARAARPQPVAEQVPPAEDVTSHTEEVIAPPLPMDEIDLETVSLDMFEEPVEDVADEPPPMRMLDLPLETFAALEEVHEDEAQEGEAIEDEVMPAFDEDEAVLEETPIAIHDDLDHATVMGALEIAILEDDEPFAPEPVEEEDEWEEDAEPEIGAPDHDSMVLLENALKAGYRLDLDDEEEDADAELLLDDAADDDENAEPPQGWLDKMIDDEER